MADYSDVGTSYRNRLPFKYGVIGNSSDVFAFNATLAGLPPIGYYSAEIVAPADWPSWIAGATGFQLVDKRTLRNSWKPNSNYVMGVLGTGGLITVISTPNEISDAIANGEYIRWTIYQESPASPATSPARTGNLVTDIFVQSTKGVGDTASAMGTAAGDAAKKAAETLGLPNTAMVVGVVALGALILLLFIDE